MSISTSIAQDKSGLLTIDLESDIVSLRIVGKGGHFIIETAKQHAELPKRGSVRSREQKKRECGGCKKEWWRLGNLIYRLTRLLRIPHCSRRERLRRKLNNIG